MSKQYPGGFITKTPTAPTSSSAPGIWTLDQAMQNQKAGNWPSGFPNYIEDVFSTWLYTGTGSAQTITNGIDLSTKGGMVWIKDRTTSGVPHRLFDTVRGGTKSIRSNSTSAENTGDPAITFSTTGFTTSTDVNGEISASGDAFVSWTFRKQPKFFDVVTYTGNGANRTIAHNLGSIPGCIIVKRTDTTGNWQVYHNGLTSAAYSIQLNLTNAQASAPTVWNSTAPTSTVFSVGTDATVNASSGTYVAYVFAHDAGGFGLTGSDNVISCGSFTTDGSGNATVSLGYEPQWVMVKRTNDLDNWQIFDVMRGMSQTSVSYLRLNISGAEGSFAGNYVFPTATGVSFQNGYLATSSDFIYIAIRRGPMKVPTSGTSVFSPVARAGTGASTTVNTSVRPDAIFQNWRAGAYGSSDHYVYDRLRGFTLSLFTNLTDAEVNQTVSGTSGMGNSSYGILNTGMNASGGTFVDYAFTRAPSFFDEVCWTGTSADQTLTHNLTVAPELIIYKARATTSNWYTACAFTSSNYSNLQLNLTTASSTVAYSGGGPFSAQPTSTQFSVGQFYNTSTMVAYLFATCAGVSKVGSYTGTAALLTVNCGFTTGARFVLIKRTDSTGDWYVYDSARGISSGTDPYLLLNSTAAETTGTNYVDTDTTGFKVTAAAPVGLNASGGTYIFLAIA